MEKSFICILTCSKGKRIHQYLSNVMLLFSSHGLTYCRIFDVPVLQQNTVNKRKNTLKNAHLAYLSSLLRLETITFEGEQEHVPITGSICLQASKKGWVRISPCSDFTSLIPSSAGAKTDPSISLFTTHSIAKSQ